MILPRRFTEPQRPCGSFIYANMMKMDNVKLESNRVVIKDLTDLTLFAKRFLSDLDGDRLGLGRSGSVGATVVALRGDLGSGKTAFVKECAKILGINETLTSPTFVIMKRYQMGERRICKNFTHLIHIDAYRLGQAKDLQAIGWDAIIKDSGNLVMIEWPERVEGNAGSDTLGHEGKVIHIDIEHGEDGGRVFTFRV